MTNFNNQDSRDIPAASVSAQNIDTQTRLDAQRNHEVAQRDRDDSNAFGGLLLGMLLTALVGGGVAAYYFFNNQRPNTTNIITPANPVASPSPQVKERIIERDRIVPVPQQPSAPASNPAPNVNVTIPNPVSQQAPASPSAPAAQPAPEQRVPEAAPAPATPAGQ